MSIEAMKQALKFCSDIGDLDGPYPYVNGTSIVSDSRKVLPVLRQAIAEAEKQEPVAWAKFNQGEITHSEMTDGSGCDFDLRAAGFVPLYTASLHASDISQERVDETAKYRHDLVYRLRKRSEIRRQISTRKSVQEGHPDRIADLLEEAADALEKCEWAEQPDLARVGEVGVWGEEKNT